MKLNELIKEFGIWTSNEEHQVLDSIKELCVLESFSPREQTIINQLIRKSLIIKIHSNDCTYIYPNY